MELIETHIVFEGLNIPSKKNSRRSFGRINLPSEAYEKWHKQELPKLQGIGKLYPPYSIALRFYPGSLKNADMTNKAESIHDILVDAGVLEDDNWFGLTAISMQLMKIDIENPRIEVMILSSQEVRTIADIKAPLEVSVKEQRKILAKAKKKAGKEAKAA